MPNPNLMATSQFILMFLGDGRIIEVQFAPAKCMNKLNMALPPIGIAQLKLKNKLTSKTIDEGRFFSPAEKLTWVRQLADWQKEIIDSHEFIDSVKFDALSHRIFVFSPKGDAYDLPEGATPVDFAYAVHSQLGDQAVGASERENGSP